MSKTKTKKNQKCIRCGRASVGIIGPDCKAKPELDQELEEFAKEKLGESKQAFFDACDTDFASDYDQTLEEYRADGGSHFDDIDYVLEVFEPHGLRSWFRKRRAADVRRPKPTNEIRKNATLKIVDSNSNRGRLYWPSSGRDLEVEIVTLADASVAANYPDGRAFQVVGLPDAWNGREVEVDLEEMEPRS